MAERKPTSEAELMRGLDRLEEGDVEIPADPTPGGTTSEPTPTFTDPDEAEKHGPGGQGDKGDAFGGSKSLELLEQMATATQEMVAMMRDIHSVITED